MTSTIIQVENLSKRYRIGTRENGYKTFREAIIDGFTAPIRNFKRLRKLSHFDDAPLPDNKELITNNQKPTPDNRQHITDNSSQSDVIWALKDVSFEVKQGEVLGIIGSNGSGKSTLLKILSRITEPTSGEVKLHGRVSSLLEVGTGFHPELTGRENIYLNGAILGMRRKEIENKFDEIVDFAEIEKFIDTPVKRYSSGMYVRLAFAVAAHLEPEILLVDEVLAVGDAQFQKKCLGKMEEVAGEGRTILFVSHKMGSIEELCPKSILLKDGELAKIGTSREIISIYLDDNSPKGKINILSSITNDSIKSGYKIAFVELMNKHGKARHRFEYTDIIRIRIAVLSKVCENIVIGVGVRDYLGYQILHFNNKDDKQSLVLDYGINYFELNFKNYLSAGNYFLTIWIGDIHLQSRDYAFNCVSFSTNTTMLSNSLSKGAIIQPGFWNKLDNKDME